MLSAFLMNWFVSYAANLSAPVMLVYQGFYVIYIDASIFVHSAKNLNIVPVNSLIHFSSLVDLPNSRRAYSL